MEQDVGARELIKLYDDELRPLLAEHRVVPVEALDQMRAVLEQALKRSPTLSVGFVGSSQVGKSSIINALLGERVVPAGGLGPLTAQATTIGYRDVNALEVHYHRGDRLNWLRLSLQSYLKKRGEEVPLTADTEAVPREVEAALDADLAKGETAPEEGAAPGASPVGEHMLSQVRLMLQRPGDTPEQTARIRELPRRALLEVVLRILGQANAESGVLDPEFDARVNEVRRVIGTNESIFETEEGSAQFRAELRLRAAQWRSPLVSRLQVHLRLPILQDLTLVDLPGVGNVGDPGAEVAREFVTAAGAGALVVVFRNNGLTEDVVEILERAGVFTRLLWGGRGGRPAIRIIVGVTHVDSVAQTRFNEIFNETGETPSAEAIFRTCAEDMTARIRDDLRHALEASKAYQEQGGTLADREAVVKKALAEAIDVVVVDAKDYLQIREKQTRGRFLDDEEATNVPKLKQILLDVVQRSSRDRRDSIVTAQRELHASASDAVTALARLYKQGGGRHTAEWDQFRVALAEASLPTRARLTAGREAAGVALRDTVPSVLDEVSAAAKENALKKLKALRRQGEGLYWPSLNAALKRGGVWEGKKLDYPGSLTRAMVDTIAAAWETSIVERVRGIVRDLAAAESALVEDVCARARDIDASLVADTQIEAQKKILRQQASSCIRWTNERLEELREDIQPKLRAVVEEPIQSACERAMVGGKNRGPGASERILTTFEDAGSHAIDEAAKKARTLLRTHYQKLISELERGYLREHHDPVSAAVEALTGDELTRAQAADQEAKRKILRRVTNASARLSQVSPQEVST